MLNLGDISRIDFPQLSTSPGLTANSSGTQAGGTPMHHTVNLFSTVGASGYSGVLPKAEGGRFIVVTNSSANSMKVFPLSTDQINALGASNSYTLAAATTVVFYCPNKGSWFSVSSGSAASTNITPTRVVPTGASDAATASDVLIGWKSATTSAKTESLPAGVVIGQTFTIKDEIGTAGTYNITITPNSGTIDGVSTYILSSNYEAVTLVWDGTSNYMVI